MIINFFFGFFSGNCVPKPLPPETTIHLIRENKSAHGLCHNLLPLQNFTQCSGNCHSHTQYDPGKKKKSVSVSG